MTLRAKKLPLILIVWALMIAAPIYSKGLPGPEIVDYQTVATDTIPIMDNYGDFLTDPNQNPFDIKPDNVVETVEYDPETNTYILSEKIGEEYYRMPTYLTFEEYLEWQAKSEERKYFEALGGIGNQYKSKRGIVDPISKVDIEKDLIDRLFGGTEVTIKPQGNIDLTFIPLDYSRTDNPNIPLRSQRRFGFDLDPVIQMNVDGGIGEKLDLGFNYNTQATFDFDRKIKLAYDSEEFNEDDIIKKIEAGNVSLPLRSTLIQGAQSLFGLKTEVQFGHLRLTGIASQQKSRQETLSIQNGATVQQFEIRPDEYDENRHFFISHYHRQAFEGALSNLPYIQNAFRVNRIEVWISDDRPDYQQNSKMVAAIADLGEGNADLLSNEDIDIPVPFPGILEDIQGNRLPSNNANYLFEGTAQDGIAYDDNTRRIERAASVLRSGYGLEQTTDFEIYRGRLLNSNEYTFNPELGFVSLNIKLKPNQVLGVAYDYYYTLNCDTLYKVGELSQQTQNSSVNQEGEIESESVHYVKLIKSSTPNVKHPSWDLMMKNVYSLRTSQLGQEDFKFDIFFEDDQGDGSLKKFLPDPDIEEKIPLLNVFNLDRLNSRGDPQPDGVFDFVPGITVIPRNGSIIFPVLEPFGNSLDMLFDDPAIADRYKYTELYDSTITVASQLLYKNKFVMAGEVKSSVSSEISLGAWNIPQGSVTVRAGSNQLREGIDFEVDYGIGRVRIINEAYLQQGVPINVSFEDNSVFSFQQKTMMGLRADYAISKHANIGATYMRLFERPFTEKVNIGDDPINNRIIGMDFDYSKSAPWITRAVDKLPFYSTKEESNVLFTAEVAALRPGHAKVINLPNQKQGVVSIDDFEGAVSTLPLGTQLNQWSLSSVPDDNTIDGLQLPEFELTNDIRVNVNRALLNWYIIDRSSLGNRDHSYVRAINQNELFDRDLPQGQLPDLFTFDLSYYPDERGPYNFDSNTGYPGISSGVKYDDARGLLLEEPESRWAGVTRYLNNNDFEAANFEFIEFWLLNPFMEREDGTGHEMTENGKLVFHLGNVSEDVMKDNLQFYENAIPVNNTSIPVRETELGRVPLQIPANNAFDLENRDLQDLGYDGLTDSLEKVKYEQWITEMENLGDFTVRDDPSNDKFLYFNDEQFTNEPLLERYKRFNNPEGNAPDGTRFQRGNPYPDGEDLNNNNSLDQGESYYKYAVQITESGGLIDETQTNFIREVKQISNPNNNQPETWYRFQIPLNDGVPVNGIQGFRSIQFMRMITSGFTTQKTFRLADFQLVRNQWRRQPSFCKAGSDREVDFSVDVVGVEENTTKAPFGYIVPKGIKQERLFNTFETVRQDENSLALSFCNLGDSCEVSITKLTELDMRFFERLQMFIHAEESVDRNDLEDGDLALFVRVGKDYVNNYYEYEIPLTISREDAPDLDAEDIVWRPENNIDFELSLLTELKKLRNISGSTPTERYNSNDAGLEGVTAGHTVYIKGNPTLGFVKGIQVGIRNVYTQENLEDFCGEVWINELRAAGFKEKGGVAGLARMDIQMADLGNVTVAGNFSTIGWGGLDQKLQERNLDKIYEYDVATNLELGKLLPNNWNVKVPFYAQYAKSISTPLYDPYALDLTVEEMKEIAQTPEERQDVIDRSNDITTIKTINFTNVRKEKSVPKQTVSISKPNVDKPIADEVKDKPKNNKPMPWDISNFSFSYSYTEIDHQDPILSVDNSKDYNAGMDYNYSLKSKGIYPFKKLVKSKKLKFIQEINFNPVPSSFSFSTDLNRLIATRRFRLPDTPIFEFDDRKFDWERRYNLKWDLMKNLKFSFLASNTSFIDELRQTGITEDPVNRMWVDEFGTEVVEAQNNDQFVNDYRKNNLRDWGRNVNYNHQFTIDYTLPTKVIPVLDWFTVKAQYRADYSWIAGPLIRIDEQGSFPGAVIQNGQDRSLNATLDFDKFYQKFDYLKKLDGKSTSSRRRGTSSTRGQATDGEPTAEAESRDKKKKDRKISAVEKILVRPILSLRNFKFTYKENLGTVVPGFMETPQFFGLGNKFTAPGWKFVTGLQPNIQPTDPNNDLLQYASNEWINPSLNFNQQVSQTKRQNFDASFKFEPWKDLSIDIDFRKQYQNNNTQEFKNKNPDLANAAFSQFAYVEVGSFDITYMSLQTMFGRDVFELVDELRSNRIIISNRLSDGQHIQNPIINPFNGFQHNKELFYEYGYGSLPSQVVVPAFLAAYQNVSAYDIELDVEDKVSKTGYIPRPNWTLRYDGLSKLPMFDGFLSNFSIEHSYVSNMRVNQFNTNPEYRGIAPFGNVSIDGNYFSRLDIPAVVIDEQFAPLIGIEMTTENDFTISAEYRKSRTLQLTTTNSELQETQSTGIQAGVGYTFPNVVLFGGKKKKRPTRERKVTLDDISDGLTIGGKKDDDEEKDNEDRRGVNDERGNPLVFDFSFAYRDDFTYPHELDNKAAEEDEDPSRRDATRGQETLSINPSLEYEVNKNLSLRTFVDYRRSIPKVSTSFKTTTFQFGITLRFKLN